MSWYISKVGSRAAVKQSVQADVDAGNLPKKVGDLIVEICEDVSPEYKQGIRVVGSGHLGGGFGSVESLEVKPVDILEEPKPAPAPAEESELATGA